MAKQKNKLFEEFKDVFEKRSVVIKNPYMINRLLSFSKQGFYISIECNRYLGKIPNELLLLIYNNSLKGNAPFIKYAAIPKIKEPKLISKICLFFNCSHFTANQYIKIYRRMGIKIEEKFGLKTGE